ncbi:DUF1648 domain-containing protein [Candidatus Clostridium radicumherbarum]|uniref:DUF1648 domain-containing protein n=1 Tax=Candidatus Clostridium radicumherbarum TaxID=3381662 RepID=A0ABW8TR16_9CLOT
MNFKKSVLVDILLLIIPIIIMFLITPILPDKVPIHWNIKGVANEFIDKKFSFILGIIPFVIYESIKAKYSNK